MGLDVTVAVGTYGQLKWDHLAKKRAIPSALAQDVEVIHVHGDSLQEARNRALDAVDTEWVVHLDADDELEPGYFDAMATGTADLRAPSVRYMREGFKVQSAAPYVPKVAGHLHSCKGECLPYGNWLVVGSLARTELVKSVGGWRDFSWSEDWDLWARCYLAGATIEAIPDAIYRAYARWDSRNRKPSHSQRIAAHNAIAKANGFPEVA